MGVFWSRISGIMTVSLSANVSGASIDVSSMVYVTTSIAPPGSGSCVSLSPLGELWGQYFLGLRGLL